MAKKNNNSRQPVLHQLVVKAPQRRTSDVGEWRTALRAADTGRVKMLYDLFDDLLIDGVLSDAMQKRIDAVCNSELTFTDADGAEVEELTALIDTIGFEEMLGEILKQRFYGRSGFEMEFPIEGGLHVHPIPAKHINLASRCILINDSDEKGIPYEGDPFLCVLGKERDFGLLLKAAPYVIYKRGGFGDWAQWMELFGMPQRVGKYNTYDPDSRRLLEEAFEKAGSAPWVVIPKDSEVETRETSSGSGSSYNEFRQACNEEMLITILGQTMTTVQGQQGARSLGEVHKEVEESKNRSDLRYVQRVLNTYVRPMLAARGYPVEGGTFTFPKAAEPLSVSEIVQLSDILEIPASYLHEKYAIPTAEEGEVIARRQATTMPYEYSEYPETSDNPELSETSEKPKPSKGFLLRLWDFFANAPRQRGAIQMATSGSALTLSEGATMEERLIVGVAKGEIKKWSPELFEHISQGLLKAVRTGFERPLNNADQPLSFEYGAKDDAFITAMEMNLFRFSAGKTLAEVQALNEAFRASKSYEEFEGKAEKIVDTFNKRWQQTEYNTALVATEQASKFHRLRSKANLYPYWEYRTVGDDRVRPEHTLLDGMTLKQNDKRWEKLYPPNNWNCRCYVVPKMKFEVTFEQLAQGEAVADEYMRSDEYSKQVKNGWAVNRAERATIYEANQQYVKEVTLDKAMEKLHAQDYGLKPYEEMKKDAAPNPIPLFDGDPKDWYEQKTTSNPLRDYKGRQITINHKTFMEHATNDRKSREYRAQYLLMVEETLRNPDEVWLQRMDGGIERKQQNKKESKLYFDNLRFIKFYNDMVMSVVCKPSAEGYTLISWYPIQENIHNPNLPADQHPKIRYRRGLLVKSSREAP